MAVKALGKSFAASTEARIRPFIPVAVCAAGSCRRSVRADSCSWKGYERWPSNVPCSYCECPGGGGRGDSIEALAATGGREAVHTGGADLALPANRCLARERRG